MRILHYCFLLSCFLWTTASFGQDNWIGINYPLDVKAYAGKNVRFSASIKTNGSPDVLALMSLRVNRENGQWGLFNNGVQQPASGNSWTTYTLEGKLDTDAATLNLGLVCMGNGTCYYDALTLQVETTTGNWQPLTVNNNGFETAVMNKNNLPQGWQVSKSSPNFIFGLSNEAAEGSASLSITGFGHEENAPVSFIKSGAEVRKRYNKAEYMITMRDGVKLFTAVYTPKDASPSKRYPIMLQRTPYSIAPYGVDNYSFTVAPSKTMMEEGYIFVHQDVRGRFKSEGEWTNIRPHNPDKKTAADIDESTDTWDTIDWLLKNLGNHNGKAGQWGISYPGFFSSAGSINAHPALKAVSPQAPVADFWFDDFHHNGAFTQAYFPFFPIVGAARKEPGEHQAFPMIQHRTNDSYGFYRSIGTVKQIADSVLKDNFLWKEITAHSNYDAFWKTRRITDHLKNLKPAYLIVGGWFDAEDLYGTLTTYKEIEKNNPNVYNTIVMGPFGHGDWAGESAHYKHHQVYFGDSIPAFYQRNIEARFFQHFLKGAGDTATGLPEAYMFNTGSKQWQTFSTWPVANARKQKLYLDKDQQLVFSNPAKTGFAEYTSDPSKPVPYTMDIPGSFGITPRSYMSEDQRFASRRPDVLVFETGILEEDLTIGGEIRVSLNVSSTGTDADWIVKLIDVYPDNEPNTPYTPKGVSMAGYQQLVRGDVMRSRWRNSFEKPAPLIPGKLTPVSFPLQDVLHTFKKGHRIMIQVQSSWFPLIDMNPQKFVPNIYLAEKKDFIKATQRVYYGSYVEVDVLK